MTEETKIVEVALPGINSNLLQALPEDERVTEDSELKFEIRRSQWVKAYLDTKVHFWGYLNVEDVNDSAINPNRPTEEKKEALKLQEIISKVWDVAEKFDDIDAMLDELSKIDWSAKMNGDE